MRDYIYPVALAALIAVLFIGCKKESIQSITDEEIPAFSGMLTDHSGCKGYQTEISADKTGDTLSCIEYVYDVSTHKLIMKHINAGFNCCAGSLYCRVNMLGDTIFVEEFEKLPACNCNCLFDLDMEINGLIAKKYHFIFIEPYCGDQEKLFFDVDFSNVTQGRFCVKRTYYPWGG